MMRFHIYSIFILLFLLTLSEAQVDTTTADTTEAETTTVDTKTAADTTTAAVTVVAEQEESAWVWWVETIITVGLVLGVSMCFCSCIISCYEEHVQKKDSEEDIKLSNVQKPDEKPYNPRGYPA